MHAYLNGITFASLFFILYIRRNVIILYSGFVFEWLNGMDIGLPDRRDLSH